MMFGHEDKVKTFTRLAKRDELHHAYLFFGDPQVGKRLFASCFANYLETGSWDEPKTILTDSLFVSPKEDKKSLGIDDIREVRRYLSQHPFTSPRRLAVIDNAELLTWEAQSAMLKIVEEPPSHGLIILIVSDPSSLFTPLVSRFAKIYFPRFSKGTIEEILAKHFGIASSRAKTIALDSYGRIGRAIGLALPAAGIYNNGDDLGRALETRILAMRKDGVLKNARTMAALLEKEADVRHFNLNPQLQKKAIESL